MSDSKSTAASSVQWAGVILALASLFQVIWTQPPWFLKDKAEPEPAREYREWNWDDSMSLPAPLPPPPEPATDAVEDYAAWQEARYEVQAKNPPVKQRMQRTEPVAALQEEEPAFPWGVFTLFFGVAMVIAVNVWRRSSRHA